VHLLEKAGKTFAKVKKISLMTLKSPSSSRKVLLEKFYFLKM